MVLSPACHVSLRIPIVTEDKLFVQIQLSCWQFSTLTKNMVKCKRFWTNVTFVVFV